MNYLAHFHLAYRTATSYTGGLLGDFVKGSDYLAYPPEIQLGILLHRAIDSYTDQHPQFKAAQQLLENTPRRVSGIAVDMLFDHLLAKHWQRFHPTSLTRFSAEVYQAFNADRQLMPIRAAQVSRRMGEGDWLSTYQSREGITLALEGVSRRLNQRFDLTLAARDLAEREHQLARCFFDFYAQLQDKLPDMLNTATDRLKKKRPDGG